MGRTVQRALLIAIIGAALGLVANTVSPKRIPYITPPKVELPPVAPSDFVTLEEAKAIWQTGQAFFLDARSPEHYAEGHIANAFNLPILDFDAHYPQVASMLTPTTKIICYCDGVECELSHDLKERLHDMGYKDLHIIKNGWTEWSKAGYTTSKGDQP